MAAPIPTPNASAVLSLKQRRAILKKERRKRKRQALAQSKVSGEGDPYSEEEENEEDKKAEEKRLQLHNEWLERERVAQEAFKLQCEKEEAARKRKEEEERMIKQEWEAQQRREQEDIEQKKQKKRDREEAVQKMLDQAESELENGGPWMNPEAPVIENTENYGTERDIANCPFFLKTGACRFGERCSRKHSHPTNSPTLMIRGMFVTFGMEQCHRDDYDTDASLEHSEEDLQEHFIEFYHDVLPEFKSVGKVVQFKVSCNYEQHLRGNVYVQFSTEEQCREAFVKFNGRWYAGKQLHCEICPVTRWKNAICGLFDRQKCPKGKHCNFLHVFRNPGNEFWEADRDLHLSPDRGEGTFRVGRYSDRYGDRSWRHQNSNWRSPPRSERSYSRRSERMRSRSRSRERSRDSRTSQHERGASKRSDRSSWSRMSIRRRDKRSRSREKDRSHNSSRDKDRQRRRSRSKNRERDRSRCQSKGRDRSSSREKTEERIGPRTKSKDKDISISRDEASGQERPGSREREKTCDRSRSGSRKRERLRSRSPQKCREDTEQRCHTQSPGSPDPKDETAGCTTTHHRRKHSKKSKKKSKKKHKKKKSNSPEGKTSSSASEKEDELEWEEGEKNCYQKYPSEEINKKDLVQNTVVKGLDANAHTEADIKCTTELQGSPLEISSELSGNGEIST